MLFWSTRTDISKSSAKVLAMFVTAANSPSMDSVAAFAHFHVRKSLATYRALRIIRFSPNEQPKTTPVFYVLVNIQYMNAEYQRKKRKMSSCNSLRRKRDSS